MADPHHDGATITGKRGDGIGRMPRGDSQDVAGTCKASILTSGETLVAPNLEEPGSSLRRSYMLALLQFADSEDSLGMSTIVDDIDADSEEEEQRSLERLDSPSRKAVSQPEFSSRISRVPFAWKPGETAEPKREPKRDPEDSHVNLDPKTPHLNMDLNMAHLVESLQSLSSDPSKDPGLVNTLEVGISSEQTRKLSSVSVGLGTVREDGVAIGPPGTELGVRAPALGSNASSNSTGTTGSQQHLSTSTVGRPSTSTTQSSSMSSTSSSDGKRLKKSFDVPRLSTDLFKRFRARTEMTDEFIERRSLTPHGLLAPGLQHYSTNIAEDEKVSIPMTRSLQGGGPPVFGIDLNESIRLAPMKMRISHRGSSTSYRTFPLSVYKCSEFIRRSASDPALFSSPGDASNVFHLLTVFNTPPYGEDFSFSDLSNQNYTIHDASRLILLYLRDLPKPLVPSSVVRSWIMLARQEGAIQPSCPRPLDGGLDFWAEALNRLPVANRNLTKHLLTLFAAAITRRDSRGRTHITDADSRNLASAVARAMFHTEESGNTEGVGSARNVHATLALAFLVKKRGEYVFEMGRDRVDEGGFLPSTGEILEWKGGEGDDREGRGLVDGK